jgi:hypothetical protein
MRYSMIGVISTCLLLLLQPGRVQAEDSSARAESAEKLFRDGHVLLKEGRVTEACTKFRSSQREEPASGTLLALAYCEERDGRLASAWQSYRAAGELALREQHAERQAAAASRAAALRPRLSTLTVKVPEQLADASRLRIRFNGAEMEPSRWGLAVPVDGGSHVLEASAEGRNSWSFTVTVRNEGDHQTVTISDLRTDIPATPPPAMPAAPGPPTAAVPLPPSPQVPRAAHDGTAHVLNRTAWGLAIAGVAGLAIGATLGIVADSKNRQSNSAGHCDQTGCDPRGTELRNSALSTARWATASLVIGGVLGGASITLFIVSDAKSGRPGAATRASNRAETLPGLRVAGTF